MDITLLVDQVKQGNHTAYIKLYDLYFFKIQLYIKKYVHSEEVSVDLTQDVFVKLWEKRTYLEQVSNFNSYLYRIAKNHTLDYLKKASRLEVMPDEIIREFSFSANEVELMVTEQEYFQFLDNYIKTLPEKSQVIFEMCRQYEKSYDEVATALNISKSTVKHHMVSTMKLLKDRLLSHFNIHQHVYVLLFINLELLLP